MPKNPPPESSSAQQDLTVKGESIERLYISYKERRFLVNRRYQRKLVWSIDEKVRFLDSIINGFPVPIVLLAEARGSRENLLEIIDGMQRLNAIMAFIENEFSVNGQYFDLNAMATTKLLLDEEKLVQKQPVMDRRSCVEVASYLLPISIFEFENTADVDEIFRRINSGGRQLSRQELRAAGSTGDFAQVVRRISAKIRGDDSASDQLRLNEMKLISITSKSLDYGIPVSTVFWVAQGVLSKDELRQSRDEELVADLVAYMVSDNPPSSRTEFLDDFFAPGEDEASKKRYDEVERFVQRRGPALVIADFQRVVDELSLVLSTATRTFSELLFPGEQIARAPRYFQVVFLALHELIVKKNFSLSSKAMLVRLMDSSGSSIEVSEGGRWGAEQRQLAVDSYVGRIQKAFKKSKKADPASVHWITQFENLLAQSFTEQTSYDFKQGFLRLDGSSQFDEDSFEKILKTACGISNLSREAKGYILVGVSDNPQTTTRVGQLFSVKAVRFNRFDVIGIEHEAKALSKTLDQYFQMLVDKIKRSKMSEPLRSYIVQNVKLVRYYDKSVFIVEVKGQEDPSNYDGVHYIRAGAQIDEIKTQDLASFIRRYISS